MPDNLLDKYAASIEDAIAKAKFSRSRVTVAAEDGAEVYAYPKPGGLIAWGVNGNQGINILRGIRREDGADEAVS